MLKRKRKDVFNMKTALKSVAVLLAAITLTTAAAFASDYSVNYEIIAEPQYEYATFFSNGMAKVMQNGKWGYVNEKGELAIPCEYDYAASFSEGKALVGKINNGSLNEWNYEESEIVLGLVDESGNYKQLMHKNYDGVNEELSMASPDLLFNYDYENGTGYDIKDLVEVTYSNGYLTIPDYPTAYAIYDKKGNELDTYAGEHNGSSFYYTGVYSEGMFIGMVPAEYYSNYCFFDDKGSLALELKNPADNGHYISSMFNFVDGYALAFTSSADYTFSTIAAIDKNGNFAFEGPYDLANIIFLNSERTLVRVFNNSLCSVHNADIDKCGALDKNGNIVIPFEYETLSAFNEGLAAAKKDGKWGYIDTKGNTVIPFVYENATMFKDGISLVVKDGGPVVIDRYNNVLEGGENIPVECYIKDEVYYSLGDIITIEVDGKYGFAKLNSSIALPEEKDMSSWAYPEVIEAIEKGLVPNELQNLYLENITREDFAQLIVTALEEVTEKDAEALLKEKTGMDSKDIYSENPFKDTSDKNIITANKLGIINGVSADSFAPSKNIVRQDAAALLMRAAKLVAGDVEITDVSFSDDASIADYAKEAVSYVTSLRIMNGVGENNFAPKSTYTREQAYLTIVRLFNSIK